MAKACHKLLASAVFPFEQGAPHQVEKLRDGGVVANHTGDVPVVQR